MNDNVPPYQTRRAVITGKSSITPAETRELRQLFENVADTCDAAGKALGSAGPPPTGPAFERLKELNARVDTMVERIKSILG